MINITAVTMHMHNDSNYILLILDRHNSRLVRCNSRRRACRRCPLRLSDQSKGQFLERYDGNQRNIRHQSVSCVVVHLIAISYCTCNNSSHIFNSYFAYSPVPPWHLFTLSRCLKYMSHSVQTNYSNMREHQRWHAILNHQAMRWINLVRTAVWERT